MFSFMAPETIRRRGQYNRAIDYWALGVTVYECSCAEKLFTGKTKDEIFQKVTEGELDLSRLNSDSPALYDFVRRLLERESKYRLGTDDVNHIKLHPYFEGIKWSTISTDETDYQPPQHKFKLEGPHDYEQNRRQFYGDEDPDAPPKSSSSLKNGSKFKGRGKLKKRKWNLDSSLSRATIEEQSDEDNSHESSAAFSGGAVTLGASAGEQNNENAAAQILSQTAANSGSSTSTK